MCFMHHTQNSTQTIMSLDEKILTITSAQQKPTLLQSRAMACSAKIIDSYVFSEPTHSVHILKNSRTFGGGSVHVPFLSSSSSVENTSRSLFLVVMCVPCEKQQHALVVRFTFNPVSDHSHAHQHNHGLLGELSEPSSLPESRARASRSGARLVRPAPHAQSLSARTGEAGKGRGGRHSRDQLAAC